MEDSSAPSWTTTSDDSKNTIVEFNPGPDHDNVSTAASAPSALEAPAHIYVSGPTGSARSNSDGKTGLI